MLHPAHLTYYYYYYCYYYYYYSCYYYYYYYDYYYYYYYSLLHQTCLNYQVDVSIAPTTTHSGKYNGSKNVWLIEQSA